MSVGDKVKNEFIFKAVNLDPNENYVLEIIDNI